MLKIEGIFQLRFVHHNYKMKSISLTWQGLSVSIKGKSILQNCSGYCRPGQMLAIMGPSGAGKTTLLSLLAKRNSSSFSVEGEVLANSQPFSDHSFFSFGAFVYQNDLLFQNLTVRETLEFSALLKIQNKEHALERVQELIGEFQLQRCANTYVGGQLSKGISGGEKKRLCVAIEMASDPSLIILDEPTSGLDSNKAAKLLSILRKLAGKGRTVIFTIHQPSYLQYAKLDRLLLLDRGETIYQGAAAEIVGYMQGLGITVPTTNTVSDFFMMEISLYKREKMQHQTALNSNNYSLRLASHCEGEIMGLRKQGGSLQQFGDIFMASFLFSFIMIIRRDYLNILRGGWKVKVIAMQTVMKMLLLGLLYLHSIPSADDLNAAELPVRSFIFAQTTSFSNAAGNLMPALISVALSLPAERELYFKETDSKKYSPLPYFLSKIIIEYSLVLVGTMLYGCVGYWLVGYTWAASNFFKFMLVILMASAVGNSLGFFCATLFREIKRVAALTNIVMLPLLVLSGLFNKLNYMPEWSSWLQYLSPFRYGLHLLLQNQYGDQTFKGYDYQADLGINLSFMGNLLIFIGQGVFFYTASFFLLKFNTARIAP